MRSGTRPILFALAALAPLGAQTLKEALAALPRDVEKIELYRDASTLDARFAATLGSYPRPKKSLVDVYENLEVPAAARAAGTVVSATFVESPTVRKVAFWLPAKDFTALTRKLGAVPAQGLFKVKRKAGVYFLAKRGNFAVASLNAGLLKTILASKTRLGSELEPLLPWLSSYDLVALAPPSTTRTGLAAARANMENGKNPGALALKTMLLPLLDQADGSVTSAAVGAVFPPDGTIRVQAKVFFKPGSPLAELGGGLAFPKVHPLDGLSPVGCVLALGGPLPHLPTPVATGPGIDPAQAASLAAAQAEQARNTRAMAFSLGLPTGPGAPLLGSLRWFLKVDDVPQYFASVPGLAAAQNPVLATMGFASKVEMDVLPGVPSFTTTLTFPDGKTPIPPAQLKMVLTLLVGNPDRVLVSVGKVDDHTVLGVLGDAATLKAALAGYGPGFAQEPGVAAVDALLPAAAPWKYYLNLGNARDLAQIVMDGFAPGKTTLPAVPAVPPVGLAFLMDGSGLQVDGAVTPSSLAAILAFAQAMETTKGTQVH